MMGRIPAEAEAVPSDTHEWEGSDKYPIRACSLTGLNGDGRLVTGVRAGARMASECERSKELDERVFGLTVSIFASLQA